MDAFNRAKQSEHKIAIEFEVKAQQEDKSCIFCGEDEEVHARNFQCLVCYNKKQMSTLLQSECKRECKLCKECMHTQIVS